jgi:hypothetical protein
MPSEARPHEQRAVRLRPQRLATRTFFRDAKRTVPIDIDELPEILTRAEAEDASSSPPSKSRERTSICYAYLPCGQGCWPRSMPGAGIPAISAGLWRATATSAWLAASAGSNSKGYLSNERDAPLGLSSVWEGSSPQRLGSFFRFVRSAGIIFDKTNPIRARALLGERPQRGRLDPIGGQNAGQRARAAHNAERLAWCVLRRTSGDGISGFDAIDAFAVHLFGNETQSKSLLNHGGEETADGVLLPAGRRHDGSDRCSRSIAMTIVCFEALLGENPREPGSCVAIVGAEARLRK